MVQLRGNFKVGVILISGIYFILHDHLSVKKLVEVEESDIEDLK